MTDEEWLFVLPYLLLSCEENRSRVYALRDVFNAVRYVVKGGNQWRLMPNDLPPWRVAYQQMRRWMKAGVFELLVADVQSLLRELGGRKGQPTAVCIHSRTLQSTPESGARAGYDGAKRRKGSKVHIVVDTLGHLLALRVTPASSSDREQVAALAEQVQQMTGSDGRACLRRSGLYRRKCRRSRTTARHTTQRRQAPHDKTWLRPAAQTLGRGTKLRLGRSIQKASQRLRTTRYKPQRLSLHRLRVHHARKTDCSSRLKGKNSL